MDVRRHGSRRNSDRPLSRTESFEYDLNGNLTKWTDRKSQITIYEYDALDRQTFIGYGATGSPPGYTYASTIAITFDAGNRATEIADSVAGSIERTYDLLDRLTEEETPEGIVTYTYDDAGRRATMTVAGQTQVSYSYDNADRLTGVTQGTASATIAYDNDGRRTSLTLPNGVVTEYTFDDDAQLTALTYKLGMSTLGTLAYGYDASGQPVSIGGTWARTSLPSAMTSATYDDANQVSMFAGSAFTYDDNGSLTSDGTRSYTWNERNELVSLTGPVNQSFAYDATGRRRTTTVGASTTQYLYDGSQLVQELSSGTPTANLLIGLAADEVFARTDSVGTRNYLVDGPASSVALADGSGSVQTEYTYGPFGSTVVTGSPTSSTRGFQGRSVDSAGIEFGHGRYYAPGTPRTLAEGPSWRRFDFNQYSGGTPSPTWSRPQPQEILIMGRGGWMRFPNQQHNPARPTPRQTTPRHPEARPQQPWPPEEIVPRPDPFWEWLSDLLEALSGGSSGGANRPGSIPPHGADGEMPAGRGKDVPLCAKMPKGYMGPCVG